MAPPLANRESVEQPYPRSGDGSPKFDVVMGPKDDHGWSTYALVMSSNQADHDRLVSAAGQGIPAPNSMQILATNLKSPSV